jgi:hypothetical protein
MSTLFETVSLPTSCLDAIIGMTCAQVQAGINMPVPAGGAQPMATCTTTATGCSCQVTVTFGAASQMGRYSTSGTTLTTMAAHAGMVSHPYCVQGNQLLLESETGAMGMPGSGPITLVATKQ